METFGLSQLGMLLVFLLILAGVSAFGPTVWRARHALIGRYFERRPIYDLVETLRTERDAAEAQLRQIAETVPAFGENSRERRSYAVEQDREPSGTPSLFPVPAVVERLERASDDELLTILAQLKTTEGDERFADSRIAKFIGGRIEDRVAQVRAAREKQAPQPAQPARAIPVRERGRSEHMMALDDNLGISKP